MGEIDVSAFHCDRRDGEFNVLIRVRGTVSMTVSAASADDAKAMVEAMIAAGDVELYKDDFDEADISSAQPCAPMYLVIRDGKEMGVSRLAPGDQPCAPTCEYMALKYLPPAAKATGASS